MSLPNPPRVRSRYGLIRIRIGVLVLALMGCSVISQGKVIHVPQDFTTIQKALDSSQEGDDIVVAPGIYEGFSFPPGNNIVRSTFNGDWSAVRNTIIEGGITFNDNWHKQNERCILRGFTIRSGSVGIDGGSWVIGGAGTHATIEYNIISDHQNLGYTTHAGAGIIHCDGLIQNNIFENNVSVLGTAIADCHGTIQNNIIRHNRAVIGPRERTPPPGRTSYTIISLGGAIVSCNGTIRNNTIVDNYQEVLQVTDDVVTYHGWKAGGLNSCKGTIVNNIIYHTTMTMPVELDNCTSPTYCLFRTPRSGAGNITGEPRFVDPAGGDYHLKPDSPAIDAGKGQTAFPADPEGRPRGVKSAGTGRGDSSGFDIGAYEAPGRPVAVWIPYGNLLAPREGDVLPVRWEMAAPASTAIRLRLYAGGRYLADLGLGRYTPAAGSVSVKLPAPLATRADYRVYGISIANEAGVSYASSTPALTIRGTQRSGVEPGVWRGLQ